MSRHPFEMTYGRASGHDDAEGLDIGDCGHPMSGEREREAYDAGRLAGFEEGLEQSERERDPVRSAAQAVIAATDDSHLTITYHDHSKCLPWALDMLRAALSQQSEKPTP